MLSNILERLATTVGQSLTNYAQKTFLRDQIVNLAAKKLYEENELRNGNREQIFDLGNEQQQIVLPWYVDIVKAARDYDFRQPVEQVGMEMRYQNTNWSGYNYNQWRQKQREYPLSREILNAGLITFVFGSMEFPKAVTSAAAVIVTGKTEDSERVVETLTFAVGEHTKSTVNSFTEVVSIQKTPNTTYNLRAYDMDDNEIAFIPNFAQRSKYVLLQILERFQIIQPTRLYEVLFRPLYVPLINDTDVFMCGDIYDDVIYWKSLELWYSRQSDAEAIQLALGARAACEDAFNRLDASDDASKKMMLNFQPNKVYMSFDAMEYADMPYYGYNLWPLV